MDETPMRHLFRFRLSTVLILTALAAWAMACRPIFSSRHFGGNSWRRGYAWALDIDVYEIDPNGDTSGWAFELIISPAMLYPALALAAFLAWKTTRALIEYRRRQAAAAE
jgi:hypothetical protein